MLKQQISQLVGHEAVGALFAETRNVRRREKHDKKRKTLKNPRKKVCENSK